MRTTQPDPIIDKAHAIRDQYAVRFDHDAGRMFRDLQTRQDASGRRYVRYSARRPPIGTDGPLHQGVGERFGQKDPDTGHRKLPLHQRRHRSSGRPHDLLPAIPSTRAPPPLREWPVLHFGVEVGQFRYGEIL